MEKILIYVEEQKKRDFNKSIDECCDECNSLIQVFDTFVTFDNEKIRSIEAFESLCQDPKSYFDGCVLRNIHLSAGKQVNVEVACQLFNIRRTEYLNMTDGLPIVDPDCEPCNKVAKVTKGRRAIRISQYNQYKDFLIFTKHNQFAVDQSAVDDYVQRFDVFAESIDQVDMFTHYKDLVNILNIHATKFGLNNTERQAIAKALHLTLTRGSEGDFATNVLYLKNEIQKLQYYESRTKSN